MTGSLQTKNDIYYVVLNFKDNNGKRKQKWVSTNLPTKGNKKKAEEVMKDLLTKYSEQDYFAASAILFSDHIKQYIEFRKNKISLTTYDIYIHMWNKHLQPYFSEKKLYLSNVKPSDIDSYYNYKYDEGMTANTLVKQHQLIHAALEYAMRNDLISRNPSDRVDRPVPVSYIAEYYEADEIMKLLKVVTGTPIEVPVFLACFYGLRRSECLGLKWENVDFDKHTLTIRNTLVRGVDEDGVLRGVEKSETKTNSSMRTLPLEDHIYNYLVNIKKKQSEYENLCGDSYNQKYKDYVCINEMGDIIQPDYVTAKFRKILDKNGLKKIRFHDLRHSCVTLLMHLGYSQNEVRYWVGHSSTKMIDKVYAHFNMEDKRKMLSSISDVLQDK